MDPKFDDPRTALLFGRLALDAQLRARLAEELVKLVEYSGEGYDDDWREDALYWLERLTTEAVRSVAPPRE